MKRASDEAIESSIGSCERWERGCGAFVVLGLALEFLIALNNPRFGTDLERWGPVLCDIFVTVGVVGEIGFTALASGAQSELTRRSNERLVKAETEAAEMRRRTAEIEQLTSWRRLTPEKREIIASLARDVGKEADLLIEYQMGDPEACTYARDIWYAFVAGGMERMRLGQNSFLQPVFGTVFCSQIENVSFKLAAALFPFVNEVNLDLSTHLSRSEAAPNLYIFVAPKSPPDIAWDAALPPEIAAQIPRNETI